MYLKNCFEDSYAHFKVNVNRDHVVFSLNFKKGFPTAIKERARRELSIDVAVGGPILKTSENTTWSRVTFTPKWVRVSPELTFFYQ